MGTVLPSGLVRATIYEGQFRADGIAVRYVARTPPMVARLHEGRPAILRWGPFARILSALMVFLGALREKWIVHVARRHDVVYLQKVASAGFVKKLRERCRARLVYDLNDGLWLPARRGYTGGRLNDILKGVDSVTADNDHLCEYARRYNASVFRVPDCPQLEVFERLRSEERRPDSEVVLGWVGSPGTAFNLFAIWEPLEELFRRAPNVHLRLLGVGDGSCLPRFERVRFSVLPSYSQEQMVREVLRMHVGLFPLFAAEDSLARGVLKATVYMCGGACVITRPIGESVRLIKDGVNGVLAETPSQWSQRLFELVSDGERRERLALAGLQTMRESYTLEASYQRLKAALLPEL